MKTVKTLKIVGTITTTLIEIAAIILTARKRGKQ